MTSWTRYTTNFMALLLAVLASLPTLAGATGPSFSYDDTAVDAEVINASGTILNVALSTTTLLDISISTVAIKGANGTTINSQAVTGGEALMVINKGATSLEGLTFVYAVNNAHAVGVTVTLAGLGNEVIIQAIGGFCEFTIDGGATIRVPKDNERVFQLAHLILNPDVLVSAKESAPTICTTMITGAN